MFRYTLNMQCVMILVLMIFLAVSNSLEAQNLLANGDFEDSNMCSEYQVKCAPEAWFRYPPIELDLHLRDVDLVYQGKKSEMVVVENRRFPLDVRLYLYSMLLCPLEPGQEYQLSFYLNPIYDTNYKLEVVFTDRELIDPDISPIGLTPDIKFSNKKDFVMSNSWILKEATFIADGNEVYINIGNFSTQEHKVVKKRKDFGNEIVYLIDNIKLIKTKTTASEDCDVSVRKDLLYKTNRRHTYVAPEIIPVNRDNRKPPVKKKKDKKEINHFIPDFAFDFNQSDIKDEYYEALDKLVTKLNSLKVKSIEITGHTDDSGDQN